MIVEEIKELKHQKIEKSEKSEIKDPRTECISDAVENYYRWVVVCAFDVLCFAADPL